jgi:integrase
MSEGHIQRRGKHSWRLKFETAPRAEDGSRFIGYETVRGTKKDAQRRMTEILQSIHKGSFVEPTSMTIGEYLGQWLAGCARHNVSAKTYERYSEIIEKHLVPAFGTLRLTNLKPLAIQAYYSQALIEGRRDGKGGLAPRTVMHHHRVLRAALKQAVGWRLLDTNPAEAVKPPQPDDAEIEILLDDELHKVLKMARTTRAYPAILLAATTGMRRGEILGLRWRDVSLDSAVLTVNNTLEETKAGMRLKEPKSKRSRRNITLPTLMVDALREHKIAQAQERLMLGLGRADDGYVFTTLEGGPVRPRNLSKEFTRIVERAGARRVSLHSLRHTHASQLLKDGVHVKVVSERLGHSSISITLDIYAHTIPNMQADAAARIDAAFAGVLDD